MPAPAPAQAAPAPGANHIAVISDDEEADIGTDSHVQIDWPSVPHK